MGRCAVCAGSRAVIASVEDDVDTHPVPATEILARVRFHLLNKIVVLDLRFLHLCVLQLLLVSELSLGVDGRFGHVVLVGVRCLCQINLLLLHIMDVRVSKRAAPSVRIFQLTVPSFRNPRGVGRRPTTRLLVLHLEDGLVRQCAFLHRRVR